jgi:soluble lytic murein transglycosylase-like protein
MPAQYIAAQPTSALTIQQFQALPPAEQARRLQTENDRRALARLDANVAKPPAALFDIASLPVTAGASLIEKGANAIDFARFGRAIGLYDPDVTSVTVPGSGSFTPFYDRLRKTEAANQPLTAEQFQEQLRARPTTAPAAAPIASPGLVAAMIQVESAGRPSAVSGKGAVGLMQVLPTTAMKPGFGLPNVFDFAEQMGTQVGKRNEAEAKRLLADPAVGAAYGQRYMDAMLQRYNGSLGNALAAYNAGPGAVDKWLTAGADPSKLPKETREYIPKVLAAMSGGAAPAGAAAAAPTASAGPAVQILTPTAGVAEKTITKPTEFYTANTNAIPADRKILDEDYGRMRGLIQTTINNQQQVDKQAYDSTRAALAQQFTAFMQAGIPSEAQRIRAEVVKLDSDFGTRMNTANTDTQAKLIELDTRYRTGRLMVDGMDAVTRLEYGNDPRALEQVLSFHTGQPVTFQPVADGTYIMSLNGNPRGTYTRAQVGDMAKEYFDVEYRKAKAASQAKFAEIGAKSRADQDLEIVKANAKMIGDATLKMIEAGAKMREVVVEGRKIKLTPTGDGSGKAYVYSEDGANLGVLDPRSGQMQDLNGVPIPLPPIVIAAQRY